MFKAVPSRYSLICMQQDKYLSSEGKYLVAAASLEFRLVNFVDILNL